MKIYLNKTLAENRELHKQFLVNEASTATCRCLIRDNDLPDEPREFARRLTLESVIRGRAWSIAAGNDPAWSEAMYDIVEKARLADIPGVTNVDKVKTLCVWLGVKLDQALLALLGVCEMSGIEDDVFFSRPHVNTALLSEVEDVLWQEHIGGR